VIASAFTYTGQPARVVFGAGTKSSLRQEAERLKISRALVISTKEQAGDASSLNDILGPLAIAAFCDAKMHTPAPVTQDALSIVKDRNIDGFVAIGGGSAIGLGKALAFRTDLPQIVLPTTYAGSEMTPILGETRDGQKHTVKSASVLPETVIYDVNLTLSLPVRYSGLSGMNAIAHAVEAVYAQDRNPIMSMFAVEGIRSLAQALPTIAKDPNASPSRADALYGAMLCGMCLGSVGMSLHHKLCHVLGGTFELPHAETHTAILPHAVAYNMQDAGSELSRLAPVLDARDTATGLFDLAKRLDLPVSLKSLGMPESGISRVVELVLANPYWNPSPLEAPRLTNLLRRAYAGLSPEVAD
jgi:alcohol dehydrogenase class IV